MRLPSGAPETVGAVRSSQRIASTIRPTRGRVGAGLASVVIAVLALVFLGRLAAEVLVGHA
jgi:hypothetical protein